MLVDFEALRARIREALGLDHPLRPLGESLASLALSEEQLRRAWGMVEEAELESIRGLEPSEVAENVESVRELVSRGVTLVFVTLRSTRTAEMVLERLGLLGIAAALVTRDHSPRRVEQLGHVQRLSEGRRLVFVADTPNDEEAARALGIAFVRVRDYRELPEALSRVLEECGGRGGFGSVPGRQT